VGGRGAGGQLSLAFPEGIREGPALREDAARATQRWLARAVARWPRAAGALDVSFALRGRAAGDACSRTGRIRYNAELLERYGERFLAEIVPHEVAHVVVGRIVPGRPRPHGPEWKAVMRFFGVAARSCHAFETRPARRVGRVPYRCACAEPHLLTPRAHRRIRRGHATYTCRLCRQELAWVQAKP
jgi:SprT protein